MRNYMQRGVVAMGVLAAGAFLPGCIVGEIRDDLKSANARLGTVDQNLAATMAKLDIVDRSLAETNTKLSVANERLSGVGGSLDTTNTSLDSLDERVRLLASIDKSLTNLDAHLASLRTTIGRIDSSIPFLDLGGDAPVETAGAPVSDAGELAAKGEAAEEGGAKAGGEGAATAGASGGASTPRDAWVGPWVSADPRWTYTLVLMADGRYMREESYTHGAAGAQAQATRVDLGTWQREGSGATLELVLTPRDGAKDAAGSAAAARLRVLHQTSRTLTLSGGEGPRVLRKP